MRNVTLTALVLGILICAAPAWSSFTLITGTETSAVIFELTPNTARVEFYGWQSTDTITVSDYSVVALKHVGAIQSVDSANVVVSGFPSTLFSYSLQASCSNEFGVLFGATASAFSSNPNTLVPSGRSATIVFWVTIKPAETMLTLQSDLDTGNLSVFGENGTLGGSPVAGSGESSSGSLVFGEEATMVCLLPGAGIYSTSVVNIFAIPTLAQWGMIALAGLLILIGIMKMWRRAPVTRC